MSDYISREAAIKAAERAYGEWNLAMAAADGSRQINLVYKRQELLKAVASVFDIVPAADVEPVRHVRRKVWGIDEYYGEWLQCPRCLYSENASNAKYCGGCGAKIDLAPQEGDSHG